MIAALKTLAARWRLVLAAVIPCAALTLVLAFHVRTRPALTLTSRAHTVYSASAQVLVDTPLSAIGDIRQAIGPGISRATVYGDLMTTDALISQIAAQAHVPARLIAVTGPLDSSGQRALHPAARLRSGAPSPYALLLNTDIALPTIMITAHAPTGTQAAALATAAGAGLRRYVDGLEAAQGVIPSRRVEIRPLGAPAVSSAQSGIAPAYAPMIFLALLAAWCVLLLLGLRFAQGWRETPPEALIGTPAATTREPRQRAGGARRAAAGPVLALLHALSRHASDQSDRSPRRSRDRAALSAEAASEGAGQPPAGEHLEPEQAARMQPQFGHAENG